MTENRNLESTRAAYDAFIAGDIVSVSGLVAEDATWHMGGSNPFTGDYKGRDEVLGLFATLVQESGGTFKLHVHDILANDEHAVALVRETAERNGKTLDHNTVHVIHLNGEGQAREFWAFPENTAVDDAFWS